VSEDASSDSARDRELVEALDEGVVFQDRDGYVVACNTAAARILGVTRDALIGSRSGDPRFFTERADGTIVPPDQHTPDVARLTGTPQSDVVLRVRRPDGDTVWLTLNARPVFEPGETEASGVVLSFTDITRQRDAEAQRMESLGRLAGGIAHDFNNLLGVILNYAHVIARHPDAPAPIAEDARRIQEAAEHGTDLVRQLLLFSRRESGSPRRFDVRPVIDEIVELVLRPFGSRIELNVDHTDEPCFVVGDRGQLGQVVLNLLLNARDAVDGAGRIALRSAVVPSDRYRAGSSAVVTVSDDGCGMSDDVRLRAFEPFFSTKQEGSGLGLAAAYGSITAMGGRIEIQSAPGVGTTVRLMLPTDIGSEPVDGA
jgi:two-component system, cell cycle sensor histidine kinase and response regulator CckA